MPTAQELLAAGEPQAALAALQQQVRDHAADPKLRVFLFQLLAVLGQWQRALNQLELCGEMDAGTLAMVGAYREALNCEPLREAVFAGKTTPMVFGQPQTWVALLIEALQVDARGDAALAAKLRADAFDGAPATTGQLDGTPFDWIADADSRLGPVLEVVINGRYGWLPFSSLARLSIEAPTDLRDLVWAPAHVTFANGGDAVALIPTRYAGTAEQAEGALQLARKTEWMEIGPQQYRGLGQRVLTTSASEVGVLEAREIVLQTSVG
ncbi:MAG TPA: type VI secretion system accessory protein TagJ [Albitalea sp.]|uniref:type VI secretion system accessory protein TagJ n=1 Tax=Piscinibacter sp. TaxID=1903157 RepID=UPI002ED43A0E